MVRTNITSDGIILDLKRPSGLLEMSKPSTGQDLQQFHRALNWVRSGIPDCAETTDPLLNLKNELKNKFGQQKTDLAKFSFSLTFGRLKPRMC